MDMEKALKEILSRYSTIKYLWRTSEENGDHISSMNYYREMWGMRYFAQCLGLDLDKLLKEQEKEND